MGEAKRRGSFEQRQIEAKNMHAKHTEKMKAKNPHANYAEQLDAVIKIDDHEAYVKLSNEFFKTMKKDAWAAVLSSWQPIITHDALKCLVEAFGLLGKLDHHLKNRSIPQFEKMVTGFFGGLTSYDCLQGNYWEGRYVSEETLAHCADKWFSNMKFESARQYAEGLQNTTVEERFKEAMATWVEKRLVLNEAAEIGTVIPVCAPSNKNPARL